MSEQWKNRIVGTGDEAPEQLLANPKNWRTHPKYQQDVLKDTLEEVGVVKSVIVNKRSGFMVDGHLRVSLAMREGQSSIPVEYVDLSEEEEDKILATLDPSAALATVDGEKLTELLAGIETPSETLQELLDDLSVQAKNNEWDNTPKMPDTDGSNDDMSTIIKVVCPMDVSGKLKDNIEQAVEGYDGVTVSVIQT